MQLPSIEWIRQRSQIVFAEYGYPPPEVGQTDPLADLLVEAVPELGSMLTVRVVDLPDDADYKPLIYTALRMLVEVQP